MISVIIPVYNTERYVGRCIDSVLRSEYTDFELILINDGSTDRSALICRRYSRKDSRIKLIEQKHMGVSAARNRGIMESRGEWLIFVDSDDLISRDFLMMTAQKAHEDCELLLFDFIRSGKGVRVRSDPMRSGKGVIMRSGKRRGRRDADKGLWRYYGKADRTELAEHLLDMRQLVKGGNTSLCSPCAKAYRKSVIDRYRLRFPADIIIGEDRIFNLEYLLRMSSCIYIRKPVYYVNERPDSAMRGFCPEFLQNDMRYQERLAFVLKRERLLPLVERAYSNSVLSNMADVLIRGIFNPRSGRTDAENISLCRAMERNRFYRRAMGYAPITGRLQRRVLLLLYRLRCYRAVKLICRVSCRILDIGGIL